MEKTQGLPIIVKGKKIDSTLFLSPRSPPLSTSQKMDAGVRRDAANTYQIPSWLFDEYINAIDILSQAESLSLLSGYITPFSFYINMPL